MVRKMTHRKNQKAESIEASRAVRLLLAAYVLVLLLTQLFTFDKFPELLAVSGVGAGWAVLLVVVELLALPFLLGMKLPMSVVRASVGFGATALTLLSVLEWVAYSHGASILFGATFELPGGMWAIFFLAALWILFFWGIWDKLVAILPKVKLSKKRNSAKKPKRR